MNRYVLFEGEVWRLLNTDHGGDTKLWRIGIAELGEKIWNRWVPADKCTLLDPALNVLFERKENGR